MRIDVVTLFPEIALAPLSESIIARARRHGQLELRVHQLRDWAEGKHRKTDDYLYGGGPGMLMKPEPLFRAVRELRQEDSVVILLSPQGELLRQQLCREFSEATHLILLCGHYEGVDQRVVEALVDREISIGDYILTNGALAAAVLVDGITRLLPGVLGDERSAQQESFSDPGLLEAPAYTKPAAYEGHCVPPVLLSGDHGKIEAWRHRESLRRTRENRPDLLSDDPPEEWQSR